MRKFAISFALLAFLVSNGWTQESKQAYYKMETFLRYVEQAYVDSVNVDNLVEKAIMGILEDLDPHSVYISKDELQKMNEPLVGNFDGIGIQFNIIKDTITVVSPITGGPSEKLGIQSGDQIVEIEGEVVAGTGIKNSDVTSKLRGEKGTIVNVGIKRKGEKKLLDFKIERDKIPIYSVDASYMIRPEIGYIKLNRFAATSMQEVKSGLDSLQEQGMKSLILDLRGNSGGYLKTAIDLADEFLGSQQLIVYTEGRAYPRSNTYGSMRGGFESGKLVVLIDEGSASASEIVSGAIQDWDRGLVIGRRSFGKGLVQKPFPLPDGSAIRLTISRYYTPTGRSIQKPYEEGVEEYYNDLNNRYEHGEYFSADSIDFPDSLVFYTPQKRVVYGGGGIMPDIFVPADTSETSKLYSDLIRKGVFNQFAIQYANNNRKKILKSYPTLEAYNSNFEVTESILEELFAYAESEKIEKTPEDFSKSENLIKLQLKALIARGFWKTNGYFRVMNEGSDMVLKAVDAINSDEFDKLKLSYKN